VDPDRSAGDTAVFWRPELLAAIVRLRRARAGLDDPRVRFEPERWPGRRATHRDEDGLHIIVAAAGAEHRLWLPAGDAPPEGEPLEAALDLDAYTVDQAEAVLRFLKLVADPPVPTGKRRPAGGPPPKRLAQTLQALDGSLAGASYRQIAAAVFGEQRVRDDWGPTSSLKQATIYLVESARALMEGGYRGLLKPTKRRR
jgi:hypothetical protein